ncbi:hypothetical protein [Methylophaga thiooxydans]|nr:hypothetical protein [Methylophaga thiooxydans]
MSQVNTIGMILYLLLAIFGGFLTGLFSRYAYQAAFNDFGKAIAVVCSIVFYVAPVWALFSLFKSDDLDVFYLLLMASFAAGVLVFNKIGGEQSDDSHYSPPD